jgi:hypothetical protein
MINKFFIYVDEYNTIIRIKAKIKPSYESMPRSGTWVIYELIKGEWLMPCFPEIVWETLKRFKYLGQLI